MYMEELSTGDGQTLRFFVEEELLNNYSYSIDFLTFKIRSEVLLLRTLQNNNLLTRVDQLVIDYLVSCAEQFLIDPQGSIQKAYLVLKYTEIYENKLGPPPPGLQKYKTM